MGANLKVTSTQLDALLAQIDLTADGQIDLK